MKREVNDMSNKLRRTQGQFEVNKLRAAIDQTQRNLQIRTRRQRDLMMAAAGTTVSTCRIKINGTGEAVAPFTFAVKYTQIPTITFGYELQSTPIDGRMPIFSASVLNFKTDDRTNGRLYTGADLLIVSETSSDVAFIVVATATGIAISGPME